MGMVLSTRIQAVPRTKSLDSIQSEETVSLKMLTLVSTIMNGDDDKTMVFMLRVSCSHGCNNNNRLGGSDPGIIRGVAACNTSRSCWLHKQNVT